MNPHIWERYEPLKFENIFQCFYIFISDLLRVNLKTIALQKPSPRYSLANNNIPVFGDEGSWNENLWNGLK